MGAIVIAAVFAASYFYCIKSPECRYKVQRMEGYRLYFYVGVYGALFAVIATVALALIDMGDVPTSIIQGLLGQKGIPLTLRGFGIAEAKSAFFIVLCFAIALTLCFVQKLYYLIFKGKFDELKLVIAKKNALEYLLFETSITLEFVSITTKSDKVYVGIVGEFDPIEGKIEYITILPMLSGYRNAKKKIKFTTNYYEHYEKYIKNTDEGKPSHLSLDDFSIVLPSAEVVTVSRFDVEAYRKFTESEFKGFKKVRQNSVDKENVEPPLE